MRQATHKGHCQICGRQQRLPAGILAKHGYTTKWGFFSGTCPGSDHLPFEQDVSLIEGAIRSASHTAEDLRAQAAEVVAPDFGFMWGHVYVREDRYRGRYVWIRFSLDKVAGTGYHLTATADDGKTYELSPYAHGREAAIAQCNERRAVELEREAKQLDEYIAWQRERIENWQPAELQPV